MTSHPTPLATCPDCGGLLQPTYPEPLTSAEVAAGDSDEVTARPRQCLICGYEAPAPATAPLA